MNLPKFQVCVKTIFQILSVKVNIHQIFRIVSLVLNQSMIILKCSSQNKQTKNELNILIVF